MKREARVLVIDDDPRLRRFLELNLQAEGYTVSSAASGRAGFEALLTRKPDTVILDLMLPDMDGFELCERIREFSDVPIIILTARTEQSDMVLGLDIGEMTIWSNRLAGKNCLLGIRAYFAASDSLSLCSSHRTSCWGISL